jgi:hypothetical protein
MKIVSDIDLNLKLPQDAQFKDTIYLSQNVPKAFQTQLTIGTYLHTTHNHRIFFYSNKEINEPFCDNQPLCYEAEGVVRFYWYHKSTQIYYELINPHTNKFAFWFTHPFFPLFLSIERYFVLLHCSAVEIDDKAIVFLAPFKSGKSTLTNYMCNHGARLIADDVLPTFIKDNQIMCATSHPYSRPNRGAETLGEYISDYVTTFKPITSIYILQNDSEASKTTITPIKGIAKFQMARKNSLIYTLKHFRMEHEKHLGLILNQIPFYQIQRPWGMDYLSDTYQTIRNHIQEHTV